MCKLEFLHGSGYAVGGDSGGGEVLAGVLEYVTTIVGREVVVNGRKKEDKVERDNEGLFFNC